MSAPTTAPIPVPAEHATEPAGTSGQAFLARRVISGGGAPDRTVAMLAAAACLVGALVATIVLGALSATKEREAAEAWLTPQSAPMAEAGAVFRTADRYLDGQRVTVARYAPIDGREAPVPPGLDRAPRAGEVFASRAAVDADVAELRGRAVAGLLGPDATRGPDDMIVLIGEDPASPQMNEPGFAAQSGIGANHPPTPIADFGGASGRESGKLGGASETSSYVHLAAIASVLLIVPVLSLMGAAARLGAGRRSRRLALLRLAGASRRFTFGIAALEAAIPAAAAAVAGVVVSVPVALLLSRVPLQGRTFHATQLMPGILAALVVVAAVTALAVGSAVLQARPAIADPLGVADARTPKAPSWLRLLVVAAAMGVWFQLTKPGSDGTGVLAAFAVIAMLMALLGPLLTSWGGRMLVNRFHRGRAGVSSLLAGRRMTDDPRAAWRLVSGVAFAAFIAGFFAGFGGGGDQIVWGREKVLEIPVTQEQALLGDALVAESRAAVDVVSTEAAASVRLGERGSVVGFDEYGIDGTAPEQTTYLSLQVDLPADESSARAVREALALEFPTAPQLTGRDIVADEQHFGADLPRATIIVLGVGFLVAATAVAVTAAAEVLDARGRNRRLRAAGVTLDVIDGARRTQMTAILLATIAPALGVGLMLGMPLALTAGGSGALQFGMVAVTVAAGIAAMLGSVRLSRGLLDVTSRPR